MNRPAPRQARVAHTVAVVAAALTCAMLACSEHAPSDSQRSVTTLPAPDTRDVTALDEPLMIALAQTKNFHHKADVYLSDGQFDEAIRAVRQILSIRFPDGAAEAEDVTLDARARLAKLLVVRGDLDDALSVVDAGIASAERRSFFLANLYTAKGEVYEARAATLDGDEDAVRAARRAAIEALDQAITINRDLQKALMNEENP